MKKYLTIFSALLLGAFVIVSCGDDDPIEPQQQDQPVDTPETPADQTKKELLTKVYVVCSGNTSNKIDGALSLYTFSSSSHGHAKDTFKKANNRSLGITANDGLIYGSKLYIVVDGENTVEVISASNHKSIKQISTTELLGEEAGVSPRHIVAKDGKIYVDTYGGYVAAIDTATFALTKKYQVGSYPEGMAFIGNTLYVANSNYGMGLDASISAIDLTTDVITEHKHEEICNPTSMVAIGETLFFIDNDVYNPETWAVEKAGGLRMLRGESAGSLKMNDANINANQIAVKGDSLFIITDSYSDNSKCIVLNTKNYEAKELLLKDFGNVNAIGIDAVNNIIFAGCYTKDEGSQWANYSAPGICKAYSMNGEKLEEYGFETGVGPTAIFFNYENK